MPRYDLRNKVALITGGARGIGFATARSLVSRGAAVALTDRDSDAVERAVRQLPEGSAVAMAADATDLDEMRRAVADTVARFGGVDVVVANAGVANRAATVRALPVEEFERVLDVNVMGVWRTVDAALPEIVRRRGHVVVLSSIYAFTNGAGAAPYAMSKAAVEQFGRALRLELVQHGASATIAYFGFIDTDLVHRGIDADPLRSELLSAVPAPLRTRLKPEVAGEAIARAIERRQPRVIRPWRWMPLSILRGVVNPLVDAQLERNPRVQALLRQLDARAAEQRASPGQAEFETRA
jgi:NAD(P)-dependent dehydrogenase (short-subunit alcohol dehydrogenase family)